MRDKCVNLIWVRLPNKEAFERLNAMVDDPKNFTPPQIKMETASSGIGDLDRADQGHLLRPEVGDEPGHGGDHVPGDRQCDSIGVRERRTEMAVLKVLGFQPRHVMMLVLGEAVLVGFSPAR